MEQRFKSSAAGRHRSRRCSPPPACGRTHTLAAKRRSSEPLQVTPAPSPCRSWGVPPGHGQKPSFSFWLCLCASRRLGRGLAGATEQPGVWGAQTRSMLQHGLGPKMAKMALSHFGVLVLKRAVLYFQERWSFASPGEASSPLDVGRIWKGLCRMT